MPGTSTSDTSGYATMAEICCVMVAALALAAWLGLAFGIPRLASLGNSLIPMAPSTSLLFILFAILGFLHSRVMPYRTWMIASIAITAVCWILAVCLLTLSLLGRHPDIEHLGVASLKALGASPRGHMSPITASSFLAVGFAFQLLFTPSRHRTLPAKGAFWIALMLVAFYSVLSLAYLMGTPLFYGRRLIPPAATTSLAFMALGLALILISMPIAWPRAVATDVETDRMSMTLIALFILAGSGIVGAGVFYHHRHETLHLESVRNQMSAIADLKRDEITRWRAERLIDAGFFQGNPSFAGVVRSYLRAPPARRRRHPLHNWLAGVRKNRNYTGIYLFDSLAETSIALSGRNIAISPYLAGRARESLHTGRVLFTDFSRREAGGEIRLHIMIPLFDNLERGKPLAVLVFSIDPERNIYQIIERWPMESATAETLLVRGDGNDALFLNQLRFRRNSALNLRIPLSRVEVPAVKAVRGEVGVVEGVDYRGVPVLAALRSIPGTPWHLVARIDSSEVYAPLRERLWITVALECALLLSAATGVGFVWKRQNLSHYRRSEHDARINRERLQCLVNVLQHGARDIQELLDYALSEALRLTFSRYGYIYYYNEESRRFTLSSWSRDVMSTCEVQKSQSECELDRTGVWGEAVRQRKPIVLNDFDAPHPLKRGYPEGHVRLTRFLTVPIIDQGRITAVVGVANKETPYDDTDATQLSLLMDAVWKNVERRRYEEELQQRTAEMERFTYTVSHDLKSPLVTISAFLGYLEADISKNDQVRINEDMGYIRNAADKMGTLLTELLQLSRVGRVVSPSVRVSFEDVVNEALQLVAGLIHERGVRVTLSAERVMFFGDRSRLVELFQNLVENAAKYMGDQAEPCIAVGIERQGGETVFFVRDNGIGVDMRYSDKIFGLFNKLDAASEGSGLGLTLVKRIVELQGGRIWVESDGIGHGSCFRFTLPRALVMESRE